MRVVCDNCGATYKIPEHKLVKKVNKATCRKCGHRMLIRRASGDDAAASSGHDEFREAAQAAARAASMAPIQPVPSSEWEEEDPTHIAKLDEQGRPVTPAQPPPSIPAPVSHGRSEPDEAKPAPLPPAVPAAAAPTPTPQPPPAAAAPPPAAPVPAAAPVAAAAAVDTSGDMGVVTFGVILALVGSLLLAVNTDGSWALTFVGLLMALWGTLTALFVLVTGSRGRRKASLVISGVLGTGFAVVGALVISIATADLDPGASLAGLADELAQPEPVAEPAAAPEAEVDKRIDALFAEEDVAAVEGEEAVAEEAATDSGAPPDVAPEAEGNADPAQDARPAAGSSTDSATAAREAAAARASAVEQTAAYVPPPQEPARSSSSGSSSGDSSSSSRGSSSGSSSSDSSSSRSSSSDSSSSSGSSSSGSSSGSSGMTGLPATVVDTMMRSNRNIKKCLYQEYKRSDGNLGTATIRFKVLSSGKVSSAYVTTSRYKNTELDSCLSAATYTVQFPPFEGDAITLEWTGGAG